MTERGSAMTALQGDLHLLDDPVAQELLGSQELARSPTPGSTAPRGGPDLVPLDR